MCLLYQCAILELPGKDSLRIQTLSTEYLKTQVNGQILGFIL